MKLWENVQTMAFGAGCLVCSFAMLALLLCVLSAIMSFSLDDPRGPGPMGITWGFLAWVSGFVSLVAGMLGFFILAITIGTKKKPNSPFDRNSA